MVALARRLVVVLIALFVSLSVAATALASAEDVINDFQDNGRIDACHARADYEAARREPVDTLYGDPQGAIDLALATPALVGTSEAPCPEVTEDEGSGVGGAALIALPIAVVLVGGAIVIARRRRGAGDGGPGADA